MVEAGRFELPSERPSFRLSTSVVTYLFSSHETKSNILSVTPTSLCMAGYEMLYLLTFTAAWRHAPGRSTPGNDGGCDQAAAKTVLLLSVII